MNGIRITAVKMGRTAGRQKRVAQRLQR